MNSRFLLPASVAGALHLAAFFGYTPTITRPPVPEPARPVHRDDDRIALVPDPPEDRAADTTDMPRGDTLQHPPVTEEPPPTDRPQPDVVTQPFHPSVPTGPEVTTFVPGTWGLPTGVPGGEPHAGPAIIDATQLDHRPQARSQIAPVYPRGAAADGRDGEVWVEFLVDETGAVRDAHVVRSNDRVFEEPTLRAVARWRFEPGRRNGRVVRFRMAVPVVFHPAE
jgi:protein TonB